jgi:hypothetical protein
MNALQAADSGRRVHTVSVPVVGFTFTRKHFGGTFGHTLLTSEDTLLDKFGGRRAASELLLEAILSHVSAAVCSQETEQKILLQSQAWSATDQSRDDNVGEAASTQDHPRIICSPEDGIHGDIAWLWGPATTSRHSSPTYFKHALLELSLLASKSVVGGAWYVSGHGMVKEKGKHRGGCKEGGSAV